MKKILFFAVILVAAGGLAAGGYLLFGSKRAQVTSHSQPMAEMDLGSKVINLADTGYLRFDLVLEYPAGNKALGDELKSKQAQVTEAVLDVLRSKTEGQVLPVKDQPMLKSELLQAINKILVNGQVKQVYFTDFLVQ